jgi:Transposase DDE domain group 1
VVSHQVYSATRGTADEYTSRLAPKPRFLRHPTRHRSPGQLTSDAGLLPIRQFDERIGLTRAFADALDDPRAPALTGHTFLEMVRSRVYGILAGYEGQNDHLHFLNEPLKALCETCVEA